MNARGISVFYGTNEPSAAIAEVRPPVGSQVVVAQFEIVRKIKLLDLTALKNVMVTGSLFDPQFAARLERAKFLQSLCDRITQPVMPDGEAFDYLATQAIADFLATESSSPVDGIIFPSAQVSGDALNVVLFRKSAVVEMMDIPEGTEIKARTGSYSEEGWEPDYFVVEEVPPSREGGESKTDGDPLDRLLLDVSPWDAADSGVHEPTLRIKPDSIVVHRVQAVSFATEAFSVRRDRWEKRDIAL